MLQDICLCCSSEMNNEVGPWFGGQSLHSTGKSGPWSFLAYTEEDRGAHRRNREKSKLMCSLFDWGRLRKE